MLENCQWNVSSGGKRQRFGGSRRRMRTHPSSTQWSNREETPTMSHGLKMKLWAGSRTRVIFKLQQCGFSRLYSNPVGTSLLPLCPKSCLEFRRKRTRGYGIYRIWKRSEQWCSLWMQIALRGQTGSGWASINSAGRSSKQIYLG